QTITSTVAFTALLVPHTPFSPSSQFFFFYSHADHPDLHSFPTRRSSDLARLLPGRHHQHQEAPALSIPLRARGRPPGHGREHRRDRKSTRLNSSHSQISYAVFCLKKKKYSRMRPSSTRCSKKQQISE